MSTISTEPCRHHWILGEPHRELVPGVCKLCGSHRDYPARLEDTDRFFDHEELLNSSHRWTPIYQAPPEEQS